MHDVTSRGDGAAAGTDQLAAAALDAALVATIIDCAPDGIMVVDGSGRIIHINRRDMDERARALGGHWRIAARPAGGTVVEWSVPVEGPASPLA